MNKKKIFSKETITVLLFSLSLCFMLTIGFNNEKTENKSIGENLKISAITDPIAIDDSVPGSGWDWADDQPWFGGGSGVPEDPYIIENLTIDGNETYNCIEIKNSNAYFTIQNCTIYNANETFLSGIYLENVTNGVITMNDFYNNYFGIYLSNSSHDSIVGNTIYGETNGTGIGLIYSNNNTITGNLAENNWQGFYLEESDNNTISGNIASKNENIGLILNKGSDLNNVSGNIFSNHWLFNIWADGIYILDTSNYNTIIGNIITNNAENGIHIEDSNFNEISGNFIKNNSISGIFLENSNSNDLLENTISNHTYSGIYLYGCSYNNLSENTVYDNKEHGIFCENSDDNTLEQNIVKDNMMNGIDLQDSYSNSLLENRIFNNTEHGIEVDGSQDNTLSENVIYDNTLHGILLEWDDGDWFSDFNYITANIIYNNNENGITIDDDCQWIDIWDNEIYGHEKNGIFFAEGDLDDCYGNILRDNSGIGINVSSISDDNLFYENFFLRNGKHAFDNGTNNDWNSTIGNYWDNYTGDDIELPHGIGDDPYNISGSGGGVDYRPIIDIIYPTIEINDPDPGDLFGLSAPSFNITVTEAYIHHIWYTLDGGLHNYTCTENGTIDQSAWGAISSGTITIQFYASDKTGKIGTAQVNIQKDGIAPIISIDSPRAGDFIGISPPSFNLTITEPNLDKIWYTVDGGPQKYPCTETGTLDQNLWNNLPQGNITLQFYAEDTLDNIGTAGITIIKDSIAPVITIISPSAGDEFGKEPPTFSINITDLNLNEIWYSLDGGATTFPITTTPNGTITVEAWNAAGKGSVTITFYADDKAGNIGTAQITITKKIPSKGIGLPYGMTSILISIISGVAIIAIITKIYSKKRFVSY